MDEQQRLKAEALPGAEGELDAVLDSPALRRLMQEISYEENGGVPRSYNRTFNRHNR